MVFIVLAIGVVALLTVAAQKVDERKEKKRERKRELASKLAQEEAAIAALAPPAYEAPPAYHPALVAA